MRILRQKGHKLVFAYLNGIDAKALKTKPKRVRRVSARAAAAAYRDTPSGITMLTTVLRLLRHPLRPYLLGLVLLLAFGIGLYMALTAHVADLYGWSYRTLAMVYLCGGASSIAGVLLLAKTAHLTVRQRFFKWFPLGMAAAILLLMTMPHSAIAWGVFSAIKGFSHAHFYHGVRVLLTKQAKATDYANLFAYKYFCLCLGSLASPLAVPWLGLAPSLGLYAASYLLMLALVHRIPAAARGQGPDAFRFDYGLLRSRSLAWALAFALGATCESVYDFIISHTAALGLGSTWANLSYTLLLGGAIGLQLPLTHALSARDTYRRAAAIALLMAVLMLALPWLAATPLLLGLALLTVGGVSAALAVLADSYVCTLLPRRQHSQGLQLSELFYMLGALGGEQLVGNLMDSAGAVWGHAGGHSLLAGLAALGLAYVYLELKPRRRVAGA